MKRNVTALYFSATGVVAKVVKEMARSLDKDFKDLNITLPDSRKEGLRFGSDDLLVVGVPVYAGRVPGLLAEYFKEVIGNKTPAVFVAVYGNRDYEDALVELRDIFEDQGFIGLAACSFIGEHSYTREVATGRPDEMDLNIARDFAKRIEDKLIRTETIDELEFFFIKGNIPYRELTDFPEMSPDTDESCIECAICAKFCPTAAISFEDFSDIDSKKCIACCSCIKRCPVDSKSMNHEFFDMIREKLVNNFKETRKEPELFI